MNFIKIISLFLFINRIHAFNLSPLSQSIEIGKNLNTVIYQIENKNKEPIAVEASLKVRQMGGDGKEELPDVKETDFLIYPTQLILKPGEKRGVKVQYLGSPEIKKEQAFRVVVEQLPIDFQKRKQTGVKLLLRYLGALYVTKEEFKASISVVKIESDINELKFEVFNSGLKHLVFKNLSLEITDANQKYKMSVEDLEGFNGENILSGVKRKFIVKNKFKKQLTSNAKVTLKYDE